MFLNYLEMNLILITFLCQVPVEHQFAMPQVVEHWPKVRGVSVDEIGTSFILEHRAKGR